MFQVACYSTPYYRFLITHNVSLDQSPITVNRTNVTLYGVQPGETYTVEIIAHSSKRCISGRSVHYIKGLYVCGYKYKFVYHVASQCAVIIAIFCCICMFCRTQYAKLHNNEVY